MSDQFKNINSNQPDDMKDYFALSEDPVTEEAAPEEKIDSYINISSTTEFSVAPSNIVDDFDYLLEEDDGVSLDDIIAAAKEENNEDGPVSRKSKKKGKKLSSGLKATIWFVLIFVISITLAYFILLFAFEYLGIHFGQKGEKTISITKDMTVDEIADILEENDVITSSVMFKLYCSITGYDEMFRDGTYNFTDEMGYKQIAIKLQKWGEDTKTVRVTIPERATIDEIMDILEKSGVCTKEDFKNAVINGKYDFDFVKEIPVEKVHYKFEGYLFPDTYEFYCYDSKKCAELAIRKMLANLDSKLTTEVRAAIKAKGYTIHQVLTMASILEMEANGFNDEMANVSAVFYNRLYSKSWTGPRRLQSDPTTKYPYGNGKYNTYEVEGLPPGPMCASSNSAILAATYPTEGFSATYFVTDVDMKFYYNNTLSAHEKTIANLKKQGKWAE